MPNWSKRGTIRVWWLKSCSSIQPKDVQIYASISTTSSKLIKLTQQHNNRNYKTKNHQIRIDSASTRLYIYFDKKHNKVYLDSTKSIIVHYFKIFHYSRKIPFLPTLKRIRKWLCYPKFLTLIILPKLAKNPNYNVLLCNIIFLSASNQVTKNQMQKEKKVH